MINDAYSPFKIVHHMNKIHELKIGSQPTPMQVQMVFTNRCNENCSFCAYRMDGFLSNEKFNVGEEIPTDKVIETIDCFKKMKIPAVQVTGGGEPLVHKDHKKFFNHILDSGIELALVTNGLAMDEENCKILSDAKWVRISIDSGNEDTYASLRRVKKETYNKVISNIENLIKYKKKNIIGIGFVVTKENYKEVVECAKTVKEMGVDNFRISASFTPEGYTYFKDFEKEARDLSSEAASLSDSKFTVFNMFNDRVKDTFDGVQDYSFCGIKDLLCYVGADQNIYTCCTLAYNHKGFIGSIKDKSFEDVWYSAEKINKYKKHNSLIHCKHPCMYKSKNEFINYCIKKNPDHTNFI